MRCIWYRVAAADAEAAIAAALASQRVLAAAHPDARFDLLRRADAADEATLMEVVVGGDAAAIEAASAAAVRPWLHGERHVEDFVSCSAGGAPANPDAA